MVKHTDVLRRDKMLIIIFKDGHKEYFDEDEVDRVVIEKPFEDPDIIFERKEENE